MMRTGDKAEDDETLTARQGMMRPDDEPGDDEDRRLGRGV